MGRFGKAPLARGRGVSRLLGASRQTLRSRSSLGNPDQPPLYASQIGRLWNFGARLPRQSGVMPADVITLAHFSVSSAMNLPKSAGDPARTVPPCSAIRALIVRSARPALISLLSVSTISAGVFLGAPTPNQMLASYPGRKSSTVGISGNTSERVDVVTAKGRSLPARM